MYDSGNWMDWLRLFGQGAGAIGGMGGMGGMGGGTSGLGLPDAGAVAPPVAPPVTPPPVTGGAMMPDAGAFMPSSGSPTPWLPNGVPSAPAAVTRPAAVRSVTPQLNTDSVMPGPDTFRDRTPFTAPQLNTDDIMPGPNTEGFRRSWWQRNVSDPVDKAWDNAFKEDPKTGQTPAMKALQGVGSMAGKLGATPAAAAPALPAGGGGAASIRPGTAINAAQMALQREQARQLLMQRATLNAPWLKYRLGQQGGLMG